MAGESARDVARRRREKAERLLRVAQTYEHGAEGEEVTAHALAGLDPSKWRVLHDLRWPGRRHANIDHLVVGPGGIFVIDSKHWSGRVTVRDQVLMQNGRKREKAIAGAADAAIDIAELLPGLNPNLVQPVLCFVRDEEVVGWARDVIVCSTTNIVACWGLENPCSSRLRYSVSSFDFKAPWHPRLLARRCRSCPSAASSVVAEDSGVVEYACGIQLGRFTPEARHEWQEEERCGLPHRRLSTHHCGL